MKAEQAEREAQALRANLRRRKQQAQARAASQPMATDTVAGDAGGSTDPAAKSEPI